MNHPTNTQPDAVLPVSIDEPVRAWRAARDRSLMAYRWWSQASAEDRRAAYAVYLAAEDQEAAAAEHLRLGTAKAA
jgi:hypothetical protein